MTNKTKGLIINTTSILVCILAYFIESEALLIGGVLAYVLGIYIGTKDIDQ
jgi:hypothetical protein